MLSQTLSLVTAERGKNSEWKNDSQTLRGHLLVEAKYEDVRNGGERAISFCQRFQHFLRPVDSHLLLLHQDRHNVVYLVALCTRSDGNVPCVQ